MPSFGAQHFSRAPNLDNLGRFQSRFGERFPARGAPVAPRLKPMNWQGALAAVMLGALAASTGVIQPPPRDAGAARGPAEAPAAAPASSAPVLALSVPGGAVGAPALVPSSSGSPAEPEPAPELPPLTATIAFAGDVLPHMGVDRAAQTKNGYDFGPMFKPIAKWVKGADLAICQLEVPLAPPGRPIATYPIFAAPRPLVPSLAKQGWDGCATATNHSLDQGWAGIQTTVGALKKNGMGYVGMALSKADAQAAQLYQLTLDGQTLTIAHLSTSYGFNGFRQPKGKPWAVAENNVGQIVKRAKAARAAGADVVLLSVHLGTEYVTKPSTQQKKFMAAIAKTGAIDAVIGGHPHVAEPIVKLPGGVDGRGMWTAYSLGNMISGMTQPLRTLGLIAYVQVTKDADGAKVTGMTWSPIVVDRFTKYKIYALADGGKLGSLSAATVKSLHKTAKGIVGPAAPEQKKPPTPSGAELTVLPHG